ncbi:MAG TPA: IS630 family transposase [Polyangiales bacterium]|nr:IS630 family transposase [Polyangiales bacterium]
MMLMLSAGLGTAGTAERLGVTDRVVRKWKARWKQSPRLESLRELDRPGRPRRISTATRCQVVKIACDRPATKERGRRVRPPVWTHQAIADELSRKHGERISRSSVQRVLSASGLRPHRVRQWLHSPDPDFAAKVRRVCKLYLQPPRDAVVVSIDEKPMQALRRRHPTHLGRDRVLRREFEYRRRGTCCLLGAFDVRTGQVMGRVVPRRTATALLGFLEAIARRYTGRRIYVVWDNLNIHLDGKDRRWSAFNRRHGGRFRFVYTPLHASWVNQIEIWFSILQRRVLRHGSFDDVRMLRDHVLGFISDWNRHDAHPFRWTFSGRFVQAPQRAAA